MHKSLLLQPHQRWALGVALIEARRSLDLDNSSAVIIYIFHLFFVCEILSIIMQYIIFISTLYHDILTISARSEHDSINIST